MSRKRKFLIAGIAVGVAAGYLGYNAFMISATYYYGVSELLEQGMSIQGQTVRVNGRIGSLEKEEAGGLVKFTLIDLEGEENLPAVYQGAVPDTFKVGNEAVIEGSLDSNEIFQADTLISKCPSKYEPE